jgi:hypothetical protein
MIVVCRMRWAVRYPLYELTEISGLLWFTHHIPSLDLNVCLSLFPDSGLQQTLLLTHQNLWRLLILYTARRRADSLLAFSKLFAA